MYFYPYKIIEHNDTKYIYLSKTGAIYKLNKVDAKILDNIKLGENVLINDIKLMVDIDDAELCKCIQEYKKIGLIKEQISNEKVKKYFDVSKLTGIMLMVSQICNMDCDYCYFKSRSCQMENVMSWHIAKKAVDELLNKSKASNITISFFGGEPLINFNLIKNVVIYVKKVSGDKNIHLSMTTNATLITQEIADFLNENKFNINVSLDGCEQKHNTHRKYKNGEGTYFDVVEGIKKISPNLITIRSTMTPNGTDIQDVLAETEKRRISDCFVACAYETIKTDDDYVSIICKYQVAIDDFYENVKNKNYDKCIGNRTIYNILYRYAHFHSRETYCDALLWGVTVDINGNIYPCHRFCNVTETVLGNINDGLNYNVCNKYIESFLLKNKDKCKYCWASNICGGNCPYMNYLFNNHCEEPAEEVCRINKIIFEKILMLFIKLTPEERKKLKL